MKGSVNRPKIPKSLLRVGTNKIDTKLTTARLCPINKPPNGQSFYDTIVFFIFCPKHRNIVVCNTYHMNRGIAVWLPFIYRSNKVMYNTAIEDGLCLILSDYEPKLLLKYKEEVPFNTHISRKIDVFSPKTNKCVTRLMCLARLHSNTPGFQCCRQTSRIHWMSLDDICKCSQDQFWAPQVHFYSITFKTNPSVLCLLHHLFEAPLLNLVNSKKSAWDSFEDNIFEYAINSLGITRKQIDLLFIDFYEHCFPVISLSFLSFVDYLSKYGFHETNDKMLRIYNAFRVWPTHSLMFKKLFMGLIYINKRCPFINKLFFLFNYYDQNCNGFLSEVQFREMVTDIHKNEGKDVIDRIVEDCMADNECEEGMDLKEFFVKGKSHEFGDTTHLLKYDIDLLTIIYEERKAKTFRPMAVLKNKSFKLFKRIIA